LNFQWVDTNKLYSNKNNEKEDKDNMNNEFNFGPYNAPNVRLSPYGMAIKNKNGKWVSYDQST